MLWWSFLLLDSPCLGPGCWSQCSVRHERFLAVFRWQVYARASQAWDLSVWWWLAARLPKLSPYFCVLWAWLWCDAQLPSNQSESRVQPGEARLTNGISELSVLSPNHNTFHSILLLRGTNQLPRTHVITIIFSESFVIITEQVCVAHESQGVRSTTQHIKLMSPSLSVHWPDQSQTFILITGYGWAQPKLHTGTVRLVDSK